MIAFGVLGYFLRKGGFPAASLVLAIILGGFWRGRCRSRFRFPGLIR